MKHFRDLVLSTKEPAVKNVLWIKPDKDELSKYYVYMYEDGWKLLFGGGGGSGTDSGLDYRAIERVKDGYVVQLIDKSDPDNILNLYPKTRAAYVYLSNNVDIETAINNINAQLRNLSAGIQKAIYTTELNLPVTGKTGNTYWVYYDESYGVLIGETYLRVYTDERKYTQLKLYMGDIVMAINNESQGDREFQGDRMGYVDSTDGTENMLAMVMMASETYVDEKILQAQSNTIQDVQVDGVSVVTNKVAQINKDVHVAYIVAQAEFATRWPTPQSRANKTFLIRNGQPQSGEYYDDSLLRVFDSEGNVTLVALHLGDLIFNIDDNQTSLVNLQPYTLYVYDKDELGERIHPLTTSSVVNDLIYSALSDFDDRYAHLDFATDGHGVNYRKLKQGEELMLVLKSMGTVLDEFATEYDYNNDNVVDWKDYDILSHLPHGSYTQDGHVYSIVNSTQLSIDGEVTTDKIIDINHDNIVNSGDLTSFINILLSGDAGQSSGEFVGYHTIFCVFDPSDNKIKIGVDYDKYVRNGDDAIILELDPSPNVVYCNSWTNELYRWNRVAQKMVKLASGNRTDKNIFMGYLNNNYIDSQTNTAFGVEFEYGDLESMNMLEQMCLSVRGDATIQQLMSRTWMIPVTDDNPRYVELNGNNVKVTNYDFYGAVGSGGVLMCYYNPNKNQLEVMIVNQGQIGNP